MTAYIIRRSISAIAVMAMVGIFVFLLLRTGAWRPGGDNRRHSRAARTQNPLPVQFIRWVRDMFGGDFGTSIFAGRPVLELISQRLEPSLSLSILTMILAATVGVSFGILAAWRSGGLSDGSVRLLRTYVKLTSV